MLPTFPPKNRRQGRLLQGATGIGNKFFKDRNARFRIWKDGDAIKVDRLADDTDDPAFFTDLTIQISLKTLISLGLRQPTPVFRVYASTETGATGELYVREKAGSPGYLQWDWRTGINIGVTNAAVKLTAMSGFLSNFFPIPRFPNGTFPSTEKELRNGLRAGGALIQYGQETGGDQQVDRIVMGDGAVQQVRRGIDVVADRYQFILSGPLRAVRAKDPRPNIKENKDFLDDHIRGVREGEFWIIHPDDHLLLNGEEDVRLVKVRVPAPHVPSTSIIGYNYARTATVLERIR